MYKGKSQRLRTPAGRKNESTERRVRTAYGQAATKEAFNVVNPNLPSSGQIKRNYDARKAAKGRKGKPHPVGKGGR